MLLKVYVLVLCFGGLGSVWATSEQVQAASPVTYDLKKLDEHKHTSVDDQAYKVKQTVFTPGDAKTVNRVVYDTHTLWPKAEDDTSKFKEAEVYEKSNLLQLVHLTVVKDEATSELYFKKTKTGFEELASKDLFDAAVLVVTRKPDGYHNRWFPLDLESTRFDRRFVTDQLEMKDGVKLRTLKFTNGRPSLVRYNSSQFFTCQDDTHYVSQVLEYEFGDDNWLLDFNLYRGGNKYFVRTKAEPTWTPLGDGTAFATKTTDFKSKYFTKRLEYDVAQKPDLDKYHVQRTAGPGNKNVLTVSPTRDHYLGKVMYGITDLWSSTDSNERVVKVKVTLLDYEVMQVSLQVHSNKTRAYGVYFTKVGHELKKNADKKEFQKLEPTVTARVKHTPFHYRDDWVLTASSLDLTNFSETQVRVHNSPVSEGVVTKTLTPTTNATFVKVVHGNVDLWPSAQHTATSPVVKSVELVYKHGLLQLVHVNGTKSNENTENLQNVVVDLHFKKARDSFHLMTNLDFNNSKTDLRRDTMYLDKYTSLDVNDTSLNEVLFSVTTEFVDGVEKKEVTANVPKVVKVTNHNHVLWSDSFHPAHYLEKLELYSTTENARLLALLLKQDTSTKTLFNYYEKPDGYAEWKDLGQLNEQGFRDKLFVHKEKHEAKAVELDVSVKPNKDVFDVKVTPLTGARTHLVLTPLRGKHVKKVVNGTGDGNALWTPEEGDEQHNKRVVKAHLYLENYSVKFLKLEVWANATDKTNTKTVVTKVRNDDNTTFANGDNTFDAKVKAFETGGGDVKFQYDEEWVLPPSKFDPMKFKEVNFEVAKGEVAGSPVKTTKYTPRPWNVVNEVVYDGAKVWPQDGLPNTDKKLVFLEVFTKDNLVQLLHVQVVSTGSDSAKTDLHFKKAKGVFTKVEDSDFNEKKESLKASDTFVDDNVKLDLSTQAPETLFTTTSVLEDGLQKTVLDLKHGKLYEVSGSPPFWTSDGESFVRTLEKYVTDVSHLVVLHVTKAGEVTKKYYEKSLTPAPQLESQVLESSPASTFESKEQKPFFDKMNQVKNNLQTNVVTFNLHNHSDPNFEVVEGADENAKLYKLYPLATNRVTKLVQNGADVWTSSDGKKVVQLHVHVHETKPKFVKAVVWKNDRTDATPDEFLYYKLNLDTNTFQETDENDYNTSLAAVKKVAQVPLEPSTGGHLPTKGKEFFKFSLSDNVNDQLFVTTKETRGDFTLKTFTPRNETLVNAVEVPHALLWKAEAKNHLWKSATFALSANAGHVDLTVSKNEVLSHLYFKFEDNEWTPVDDDAFAKLNATVPPAPAAAAHA